MTAPRVLSSDSLTGTDVFNLDGEKLGTIDEIMIDLSHGRVAYAVLSFGGILGLGDKLFALPWSAMKLDTAREQFLLDVNKEVLEGAHGFSKDDWPDFADAKFRDSTYRHFGVKPYWS